MTSEFIYCTYATFYSGNKLPPFYIGSSSVEKVKNGYHGSVASKRWKSIYKYELKENPYLFSTEIVETFNDRKSATKYELELQIANDVVKSKWFFNESYAVVNGFFGMNKTGIKRTLNQNKENSNRSILRSIINAGCRIYKP